MSQQPTADDIDKMIWVREDENGPWFLRRLIRIDETPLGRFFLCVRSCDVHPNLVPTELTTYRWRNAKRVDFFSFESLTDGEKKIEKGNSTPQRGRLTQQEIEWIQRCDGSLRSVARRLGIGKSTVDYHRRKIYDSWSAEEQIVTVDPATMAGSCYTCRFWIDASAYEQVLAFEDPPRKFDQVFRECWSKYSEQRPMTMAHDSCARWEQKNGLHYQPESATQ